MVDYQQFTRILYNISSKIRTSWRTLFSNDEEIFCVQKRYYVLLCYTTDFCWVFLKMSSKILILFLCRYNATQSCLVNLNYKRYTIIISFACITITERHFCEARWRRKPLASEYTRSFVVESNGRMESDFRSVELGTLTRRDW